MAAIPAKPLCREQNRQRAETDKRGNECEYHDFSSPRIIVAHIGIPATLPRSIGSGDMKVQREGVSDRPPEGLPVHGEAEAPNLHISTRKISCPRYRYQTRLRQIMCRPCHPARVAPHGTRSAVGAKRTRQVPRRLAHRPIEALTGGFKDWPDWS